MAKTIRQLVLLHGLLVALLLSGCGSTGTPSASAPTAGPLRQAAPADRLYISASQASGAEQLTVVDGASGASRLSLPPGVSSPDWSTLYTTSQAAGTTRVQALDLTTGQSLRATEIAGAYQLPMITPDSVMGGLSPDGRWLALVAPPAPGAKITRFVVLDTAFREKPKQAELPGLFSFDGLNNSGTSLFLTESLASGVEAPYQVRRYDLRLGALDPNVIVEKGEEDEPMSGVRQSAVASRAGDWLYSLYLNGEHGPFIHALPMDGQFAFCIDLPTAGKDDPAKQARWALVASADQSKLYAVNGALGLLVEYGLGDGVPQQLRSSTLFAATPEAMAANPPKLSTVAARSPDGALLYTLGEHGLLAIDLKGLELRGRYLDDWALDGLALSPDGQRLYAASAAAGKIMRIDPRAGTIMSELPIGGNPASLVRAIAGD